MSDKKVSFDEVLMTIGTLFIVQCFLYLYQQRFWMYL